MGSRQSKWMQPDLAPPPPDYEAKFNPMIGFPNGRKERVVKTTTEEMISALVPPERRDFCVDKYMAFLVCRRKHFPWVYKCKHEVHDYHDCQWEDNVLRTKEYERELRLSQKLAAKAISNEEDLEG